MPTLTRHAAQRSQQRSISDIHIHLALAWGAEFDQTRGCRAYHLGRREASHAITQGVDIPERAIDLVVVASSQDHVITVWRSANRHRLKAFRRPRTAARRRRTVYRAPSTLR